MGLPSSHARMSSGLYGPIKGVSYMPHQGYFVRFFSIALASVRRDEKTSLMSGSLDLS